MMETLYPLRMTEPQYFGVRVVSLVCALIGSLAIVAIHFLRYQTGPELPSVAPPIAELPAGNLSEERKLLLSMAGAPSRKVDILIPITTAQVAPVPGTPAGLTESSKDDALTNRIDGVVAVGSEKYIVIDGETFGVGDVLDNRARVISIDEERLLIERPDASRHSVPILK
jgi:hypothetical protein